MNLLKILIILSLNFGLILLFSSCEKNEKTEGENLSIQENIDILEGDFLDKKNDLKENNLEDFNSGDFFDGAEFENEKNNLGASILNGISMDGNYFKSSNGIDLHKITGYIDFGSGSFVRGGKDYSLNPSYGDKINGLKVAFANSKTSGIFDSISYGGYGMENVGIINGKTSFSIFFDGSKMTNRTKILKNIFANTEDFLIQAKFSQEKKDGNDYVSAKIHTKVVTQAVENDEGGLLFNWPCLASDFTYIKDNFKNQDEVFSSDFYEKTNTGYLINDNYDWVSQGKTYNGALCALNDTYNFSKNSVIGSQCWEGEEKSNVGKIVFRPRKDSFCVQAKSIEEEKFYPNYACNILITKTGRFDDSQEYLGGDVFSLDGEKYVCGDN